MSRINEYYDINEINSFIANFSLLSVNNDNSIDCSGRDLLCKLRFSSDLRVSFVEEEPYLRRCRCIVRETLYIYNYKL